MYTSTQLIPLLQKLLWKRRTTCRVVWVMSKRPLRFFKNLSLDSKLIVQGLWLSQMRCVAFFKCNNVCKVWSRESESLILPINICISNSDSDGYSQTSWAPYGNQKNVDAAVLEHIYCSLSPVVWILVGSLAWICYIPYHMWRPHSAQVCCVKPFVWSGGLSVSVCAVCIFVHVNKYARVVSLLGALTRSNSSAIDPTFVKLVKTLPEMWFSSIVIYFT